ncbi:MAG: tetratricopeptide repeat protein [Candidatus Sumerlaeia bacterium]
MNMKHLLSYAVGLMIFFLGCQKIGVEPQDAKSSKPPFLIDMERTDLEIVKQQYDEAERYALLSLIEIRNEKQDEIRKKNNCDSISIALSKIYYAQGKYDRAAELSMTFMKGDIFLSQGKYDDALKVYEQAAMAADKRGQDLPLKYRNHKVIGAYPLLGNYYLHIGNYERAREYYKDNYDALVKEGLNRSDHVGAASYRMALTYLYTGDDKTAEKYLIDAKNIDERTMVTSPQDYLDVLFMLGRIEEHRKNTTKAMEYYETALEYVKGIGQMTAQADRLTEIRFRVEQSNVWNQMGRLKLLSHVPDEAIAAYAKSMALRNATTTQTHPDYADALRGMAGAALLNGDTASATLQAEESLKILDAAVVPTHPRIAPTLIALSSIYELTGKSDQAAPLKTRIETILQKPLGPWKEDFMETAAFYTEQLKKANKPATSQYLEQLQARQKDKR